MVNEEKQMTKFLQYHLLWKLPPPLMVIEGSTLTDRNYIYNDCEYDTSKPDICCYIF